MSRSTFGLVVAVLGLSLAATAQAAHPIPGGYYTVVTSQDHALYGPGGPAEGQAREWLHVSRTGTRFVKFSTAPIGFFQPCGNVTGTDVVSLEGAIDPSGNFRRSGFLPYYLKWHDAGRFVTRHLVRGIVQATQLSDYASASDPGCTSPLISFFARYVGQHAPKH